MPQTPPAYSPRDILAAGQKAEAEGRTSYAVQFYRHLTDYYAQTAEAHEARLALQRISASPQTAAVDPRGRRSLADALDAHTGQGPSSHTPRHAPAQGEVRPMPTSGFAHAPPPASPQSVATSGPSQALVPVAAAERKPPVTLPPPARGYVVGRVLAFLLTGLGALCALVGLAAIGYGAAHGFGPPTAMGMTVLTAGASLIATGLVLLLLGQLALAVFRTANATTDLAAVARATARPSQDGG